MSERRSRFECDDCGNGLQGDAPPASCPKCGGRAISRTKPIYEDVAAIIRRVRTAAHDGSQAMLTRNHRKAAHIVAQFRLADEAMERAQRALFVEGRR